MKRIIIIIFILSMTILFLSNSGIFSDNSSTIKDWNYDKNEYPLDEYTLEDLPVSHKSAVEIRQFFMDSDSNHDGVLKNDEINSFDYKIKHSQYTFNGPYGYN